MPQSKLLKTIVAGDSATEFLELASNSGRNLQVLNEVLHLLDPHPMLIDFPRIIQGLINVLDEMEKSPSLLWENIDISTWREECRWIISNRKNPRFISVLGDGYYGGDENRNRNPIIGKRVKDHAFPYATLWHEPADVDGATDYYRLLAQLLVVRYRTASSAGLSGQKYTAYLQLRKLCAKHLLSIPSEIRIWSSSESFVWGCKGFDASNSIDMHAEDFVPITRLVRYWAGGEPPVRTGGGGGHRYGRTTLRSGFGVQVSQRVTELPLDDPDDDDLLSGYISFIVEQLGQDLDEAFPDGEITTPNETCLIDTGDIVRPFVAELLSHQGVLAHITRSRQYLPFGYNLLTVPELANLLFGVSDTFLTCKQQLRTAEEKEKVAIRKRMEGLLAIHLMLWFGRSFEDCKKLKIVEHDSRLTGSLELILESPAKPAEFRFLAPTPEYAADESLPKDAVRKSGSVVTVPDLVGAASLVRAVKELSVTSGVGVFSCKVEELEVEVRTLLRELGGGDSRYTIQKVRSYLHRQIIVDTHDVVAATMLSGLPCLSANTALYYAQYQVSHLRSIYCQSVQTVLDAIYGTVGLKAPTHIDVDHSNNAVGARNCLRVSAVQHNLEALLVVLRKRPVKDIQAVVHWHNCFTLWTLLMFMMATACRAIRRPLKDVNEFLPRSGQGALGDKGADDGHMSRLVVLPEPVQRQLQAYKEHCAIIVSKFNPLAPKADGFFLRLAEDGVFHCDEIRPRNIVQAMSLIDGVQQHPVNAFRKFLRTELAERGCPPETLAAFMGHWLLGEEPQDIYSSFCPRAYVQSLHAYLVPLMKALGWTVRHSHLVTEAA